VWLCVEYAANVFVGELKIIKQKSSGDVCKVLLVHVAIGIPN
jgi:hypothetical protein